MRKRKILLRFLILTIIGSFVWSETLILEAAIRGNNPVLAPTGDYNSASSESSESSDSSESDDSTELNSYDEDTIKRVQESLSEAGYDCGTADGVAGSNTQSAISQFQTDNGLNVTGEINGELLKALGLDESDEDTYYDLEGVTETNPYEITIEDSEDEIKKEKELADINLLMDYIEDRSLGGNAYVKSSEITDLLQKSSRIGSFVGDFSIQKNSESKVEYLRWKVSGGWKGMYSTSILHHLEELFGEERIKKSYEEYIWETNDYYVVYYNKDCFYVLLIEDSENEDNQSDDSLIDPEEIEAAYNSLVAIVNGSANNGNIENIVVTDDDELAAAWFLAKKSVTDNLENSSTIEFPFSYENKDVLITSSDNIYTVTAWVDSENMFGEYTRKYFVVTIENDDTKYNILSTDIVEANIMDPLISGTDVSIELVYGEEMETEDTTETEKSSVAQDVENAVKGAVDKIEGKETEDESKTGGIINAAEEAVENVAKKIEGD